MTPMARSAKQRCKEYRIRRVLGRVAVLIDVCPDDVVASGLMSLDEFFADEPTRREKLSDYFAEKLTERSFEL